MKKLLLITCAMSAVMLSGCSLLGLVPQEEMDAVVADRDYYLEEYNTATETLAEYETEIEDLEEQVADLESENEDLNDQLTALEEELEALEEAQFTVEDYYTQPSVKLALDAQIDAMKESYKDEYADLGYEIDGNTFTYWFQFKDQIADVDKAAELLESRITEDMMSGIVESVEEECGVTGITCCYIYYNADGTVIYQNSYSTAN